MRFKNRYLLIQLVSKTPFSENSFTEGSFVAELKRLTLKMFGLISFGKIFSSFKIIYMNLESNFLILRCARDHYIRLKKTLFFFTGNNDHEFRLRILSVSGTIKQAQYKASQHLKSEIKLKLN